MNILTLICDSPLLILKAGKHFVSTNVSTNDQADLKDQSGEMSATFFGRAVDKYFTMLKCGQAWLH